jgi:hypothetical protein
MAIVVEVPVKGAGLQRVQTLAPKLVRSTPVAEAATSSLDLLEQVAFS